ncbi:MAG: sugar phosphate isomerase/epimerase [Candidatus Hydrogenedentes bacterium]|nr:sugar phosphate isomerase/epimerase [Candidatus Hydrogenedentota bacterium]
MPTNRSQTNRPALPRNRVMVAVTNHVAHELRCARDYGLGCEIQIFGLPSFLARDCTPELKRMIARLAPIKGPIGCHGPFIDMIHYSTDPEIMEVCRLRYLRAFDVAEALGARYVLFHSQYNPIIRVPIYPATYREQSLRFWPEIIEEAEKRRIAIYIENMFDDAPEPMRELAEAFGSPWFKLCIDVAHAEIYSSLDITAWIDAFGEHLRHVHLNDSYGELDDHLGLGQGVLGIARALQKLKATQLPLTYALETGTNTVASLRFLGLRKLSPRS